MAQVRNCGQQVLQIVQDDQLPVSRKQGSDSCVHGAGLSRRGHLDRGGQGRDDQRGILQSVQPNERDATRLPCREPPGDLRGQASLADATRSGQGHQTCTRAEQGLLDQRQFLQTANQWVCLACLCDWRQWRWRLWPAARKVEEVGALVLVQTERVTDHACRFPLWGMVDPAFEITDGPGADS